MRASFLAPSRSSPPLVSVPGGNLVSTYDRSPTKRDSLKLPAAYGNKWPSAMVRLGIASGSDAADSGQRITKVACRSHWRRSRPAAGRRPTTRSDHRGAAEAVIAASNHVGTPAPSHPLPV